MHFIDIHSHLLANWDDGPENWETTLEMLRQGVQDGIKEVICTPHILSKNDLQRENEILQRYEELKARAVHAKLPIKIHIGAELYIQPHFPFDKKICTLAQNGRYFLMEFTMGMIPDFVTKKFFDLLLKSKTPIIAHPERNFTIMNKPNTAFQLVEKGALLQINAGSLLGWFGKNSKSVAIQLLDANLVHFIASDAHDLKTRPLKLRDAFELVKTKWGSERAHALFYENQVKMMKGEDIKIGNPHAINQNKKQSFREKLGFPKFR
jgi:protein-tyrosine phosphatase